jgi:hypothetical protein
MDNSSNRKARRAVATPVAAATGSSRHYPRCGGASGVGEGRMPLQKLARSVA